MMQAERSAGVSFSQRSILRAISTRFSCVTGTRLEVPVVPDVRKIAAQDCAVTGEAGRRRRSGRTCSSAISSNDETALVALKRPKPSSAAPVQSGRPASAGTIRASRRIRSSSSRRSAGGRLVLMGSTVAVQQTAMLNSAASGPRGRAMPTREAGRCRRRGVARRPAGWRAQDHRMTVVAGRNKRSRLHQDRARRDVPAHRRSVDTVDICPVFIFFPFPVKPMLEGGDTFGCDKEEAMTTALRWSWVGDPLSAVSDLSVSVLRGTLTRNRAARGNQGKST